MDNFEELKDFMDTMEPDDYEIRLDALTLAIHQWAPNAYYEGVQTVLANAKRFYEFLKNE